MQDEKKEETVEATRRVGYLRNLLLMNNPRFKHQFSSTPIDPETRTESDTSTSRGAELTEAERTYLESLLQQGDANMIERASQRLCDPLLFPPLNHCHRNAAKEASTEEKPPAPAVPTEEENGPVKKRRDSLLQQELFRLHEKNGLQPSRLLQQMNFAHQNSIIDTDADDASAIKAAAAEAAAQATPKDEESANESLLGGSSASSLMDSWNPFKDVASWLDGSQGVEVGDNGVPLAKQNSNRALQQQTPFRILGTAADDVSCHPHVLSPPLMESLLAFVPESLSQSNFLLKYSLVRDGANLWTMLRQVRASDITFLAIETIDGHVFGSYTSQGWRLAQGWYGPKESFLWKMRRSRLHTTQSIVEQATQESEIQVYPYRVGNVAVQYCAKDCLMLGQGELLPNDLGGNHYGHGICLDASLLHGTTSTSETFGNPCLVNPDERGACFDVSNIEVWTLTAHQTVAEAEQSELSTLFLTDSRDGKDDNLNIMKILVGGPI